jgi:hypothetical protein
LFTNVFNFEIPILWTQKYFRILIDILSVSLSVPLSLSLDLHRPEQQYWFILTYLQEVLS